MSKQQRTVYRKFTFQTRLFFRKYPSLPYILKWLCISIIIGILVGTASAGFLQSLEWATQFRENHIWLIALLPAAGFLIGLLYYYFGKDIEAGNNILIDSIHNPEKYHSFQNGTFYLSGNSSYPFLWRFCRSRRNCNSDGRSDFRSASVSPSNLIRMKEKHFSLQLLRQVSDLFSELLWQGLFSDLKFF